MQFEDPALAGRISRAAFENGLIIETAGPGDEVLKVLPPLTIEEETLRSGLNVLLQTTEEVVGAGASV